MDRYDFKVRRPDGTASIVRSTKLSGMAAVWAMVADIAQGVEHDESRIIVTNENGDVLILVGPATARAYPQAKKQALQGATSKFAKPIFSKPIPALAAQSALPQWRLRA